MNHEQPTRGPWGGTTSPSPPQTQLKPETATAVSPARLPRVPTSPRPLLSGTKPSARLTLLALASVILALAPSLSAQTTERQGRFQLGPLWLTPKVVLKNAGVDDNVFNEAGEGTSDRQAVLTPSLDAKLPIGRRLRLLGTGALGLNWFQREDSERSTDLTGNGRAEVDLGPITVFGTLGGGRYKQRFSVEVDRRLERSTRAVGAGARLRATRKLTLGGEWGRQTLGFEAGVSVRGEDVRGSLDREATTTSATLQYALSPRTTLVASADVLDDRFTVPSGFPDESRSYRYLAGFQFQAGALLTGGVRAGLRDVPERADQAAPGYSGLSLAVDTSLPLGERARLALLATRDLGYAVARAEGGRRNTFVSFLYGGTLTVELPLSLLARGSLSFERADYVLTYGALDREDEVRVAGLALMRSFGPSFRVGGNVEWARRESNLPGSGYERRSFGLTAEYTP